MFGRMKKYKQGLADGVEASADFHAKQQAALEEQRKLVASGAKELDDALVELGDQLNDVYSYLNAREKAALYRLSTPMDIRDLEQEERQLLVAVLYQLAEDEGDRLTENQRTYIRSVQHYLELTNPAITVDLEVVGDIDSLEVQKAFMQVALEFLYLQEEDELTEEQEDFFDNFSVNKKQAKAIEVNVSRLYNAVGARGVVEKYGALLTAPQEDDGPDAKEDSMLAKAERAYLAYDIKNAFSLFSYLAEQNNGRVCYFLGEIYENGYSGVVKKDLTAARKWRQLGADRGDILSRLSLAYSIEDEKDKNSVFADMLEDVLALAKSGDVFAMYEAARLFGDGNGTPEDKNIQLYWLEQAGKADFWRAINKMGSISYGEKRYSDALSYYERAAKIGYEDAITNVAGCYHNGYGVEVNGPKAFEYYMQAAQKGEVTAQLWIGVAYDWKYEFFGITKNLSEAAKWYKLAGEGGNGSAFWNLAVIRHNDGNFDNQDTDVLNYLMRSADLGQLSAKIQVAAWFCMGQGVTESMLRQYGEMEYSNHATFVGEMFEVFTKKDFREAEIKEEGRKILKQYADEGNATAQYYLGMMYTSISYLGKDKDMALKWLRKAKDQGHNEAKKAYQECMDKVPLAFRPLLGSWSAGNVCYFLLA